MDLYSLDISQWIYPTVITIVHVVSSYLGFRMVPPAWSQVIFFTYPFFILVGSFILLNKSIKLFDIIWFIPLLFSIYTLYKDINNKDKVKHRKNTNRQLGMFEWTVGIISLFVSAATEASYYLYFLEYPLAGSWNRLGVSYIGAALLYSLYYFITGQHNKFTKNKKPRHWLFAMVWNVFISGFGYFGRFWSLDKVQPIVYSALSYTGLITGYIFSVLLGLDVVSKADIISILAILFSILGLTFTPSLIATST